MTKAELIQKLKLVAPLIIERHLTQDMGHEFSAIVPNGIIYREVGMLLNFSGGMWPPDQWEDKTEKEYDLLLNEFLLDEEWTVEKWDSFNEEELARFLDFAEDTLTQLNKGESI
jgi:hypothetical protein